MKRKTIILSVAVCVLVLGSSFFSKAASSELVSIYHTHGNYCGTTTTYVTQDSNNGGGGAGLRTVSSGTCGSCGGYVDYYAFDSTCSCGKSWSTTGHACVNSSYGSNNAGCSNYSAINCNTSHSHPVRTYACGLTEDVAVATMQLTSSTDDYVKELTLVGTVSNTENISNIQYSWSTGESDTGIVVAANGTYTLTITGDNIKPASASITISNVDNLPPTITSLAADITVFTADDVTLTVSGTDASGLADKPYSWDGSTWSATPALKVSENGTYTAYVKDVAGNIAKQGITVNNIDRIAPDVRVSADVTVPTAGNVILTVSGTDASGLADMPYSWDGSTWSTTATKTVSANGTYTAYVKDVAGNIAKQSITVNNIDRIAPDVRVSADVTVPTTGNVILTVSGTDASGLADMPYSWDGTTWDTITEQTISNNGTYTAYVKDVAGNIAEQSITINNIDRIAPDIKLVADVTVPTTGNVILTVSGTDASGLADIPYSWDGSTWSTTATKTVSANGTYTAYVKDVAGNIAEQSITVNNIYIPVNNKDTTPPVINDLYLSTTKPAEEVIITVVVEEEDILISWDGGFSWGTNKESMAMANGMHTVLVKDASGNISQGSIDVTNILVEEIRTEIPAEEPESIQEEVPVEEEPISVPTEQVEEPKEVEVVEIIPEEPETKQNIELEDVVKVAAPVTGGGCFFFFAFIIFTKNAVVYAQDGLAEKCLGRIKIKKTQKGYVAKISNSMVRKATSNQYRIAVSKRFIKRNEGVYCNILIGDKQISSRLDYEMHVEG